MFTASPVCRSFLGAGEEEQAQSVQKQSIPGVQAPPQAVIATLSYHKQLGVVPCTQKDVMVSLVPMDIVQQGVFTWP